MSLDSDEMKDQLYTFSIPEMNEAKRQLLGAGGNSRQMRERVGSGINEEWSRKHYTTNTEAGIAMRQRKMCNHTGDMEMDRTSDASSDEEVCSKVLRKSC